MIENHDEIDLKIYQQEVNTIKREKSKKIKRWLLILLLILWTIFCAVIGYAYSFFGSLPFENAALNKIEDVQNLMSKYWYFGTNYEDIEGTLLNQALYGMTSFQEDPHTTYMSNEELTAFQTSINKGFVGIGVQYIDCDGVFIVTKIFNESPAEIAGVMPGDIITTVDGQSVEGMSSDEVVEIIKGESGTPVMVGFVRGTQEIELEIIRGSVASNTYGYMIDEDTGYVELLSFGDTTGSELEKHMLSFKNQGADSLIIDLRNNGGGYLTALVEVASLFLDENEVAMIEKYSDGSEEIYTTTAGKIEGYDEVVILVNENSASASEVLTLALREKFPNVTVVGTTTYGKGTVQTTQFFADGSALKYTAGIWTSPEGLWIDGEGITPDIEVNIPAILTMWIPALSEDTVIKLDEVSANVMAAQEALDFLGYEINRKDGYFDQVTMDALETFAKDMNYPLNEGLDEGIYQALMSETQKLWAMDVSVDPQLQKAIEVINE